MTQPNKTPATEVPMDGFVDRRSNTPEQGAPGVERRQFANSHEDLSDEAQELAKAIDAYKLHHRRRFLTYEEILAVFKNLGYSRN